MYLIGSPFPGQTNNWQPFNYGPTKLKDQAITVFFNPNPPLLDDQYIRDIPEWRNQIQQSLTAGNTIVVFLNYFEQDGNGPTTANTIHTFSFIPNLPSLFEESGTDLQLNPHPSILPLWKELAPYFSYTCLLDGIAPLPLALSKTHQKLAGLLRKVGKGNLILLPALNFEHPDFQIEEDRYSPKALEKGRWLANFFTQLPTNLPK